MAWVLGIACVVLAGLACAVPPQLAGVMAVGAALCVIGVAHSFAETVAERVNDRWVERSEVNRMHAEHVRELIRSDTEHREEIQHLLAAFDAQAAILNRVGLALAALQAKQAGEVGEEET